MKLHRCYNVKYPIFLSDFNETLNFLHGFSKKSSNNKFQENPYHYKNFYVWIVLRIFKLQLHEMSHLKITVT